MNLRWVVLVGVACSSNTISPVAVAPSPPPPRVAIPAQPLVFDACQPEDRPRQPGGGDQDIVVPPAPRTGMFGLAGLQPRQTPTRGAACQAARSTLDAANSAILAVTAPTPRSSTRHGWDRVTDPARWGRVAQRFGLGPRDRAVLAKEGFVVAAGVPFSSYVAAYHEIFQSQLPIYVSIDSIMHAIFTSHAGLVGELERSVFTTRVTDILGAMHCWLPTGAKAWPDEIARDADLYLTVARSLLAGKPVPSVLGSDAQAAGLVARITEAKGLAEIELFGRRRHVDFSAFQPVGHYGSSAGYFRAMIWLSRVELNLVSRSSRSSTMLPDPRETPREVALALALVDTAKGAGRLDDIAELDAAWAALAGTREDVSFAQLDALRAAAKLDRVSLDAQPAIARAIGDRFKRSMPMQVHPDGLTDLPVVATMFGSRVVPDAPALAPIIQPAVPARIDVGAADLAFLLGHDRAKAHLTAELARYPTLGAQLPIARAALDARLGGRDLYSVWLRAIRAIAQVPPGARPSYMASDAYADLRMSSAVTAFGQLRHAHALIAGMSYLGSGCEIPDGWVEPAAATYDALIEYAERGKAVVATLDPTDATKGVAYFTRLGTTLRVLRGIVATELADRPLTEAQKRWLSMVVEIVVDNSGSGAPPTYAGWYFDLFRNFTDATANARFIAGYASNADTVSYIGASETRMGVFVIDVGGAPRVVAGPVARSLELDHPISAGRLTDDDELDATAVRDPWSTRYTIAAGTPPDLDLEQEWSEDGEPMKFVVTAPAAIGPVTLELLDHHRVPFATVTQEVKAGKTELRVRGSRKRLEMLHLRVGTYHNWAEAQGDNGFGFWLSRPE